jgi:ABC-type glycerol-3-phosphate transport system substrate-binding protein
LRYKETVLELKRSLADFIVTKTWDSVQESAKQYKEDYGNRFYEINTDNISYGQALPEAFVNQVTAGLEASGIKF